MPAEKRGRLLIVDDEVELTSALCETLGEEGYTTLGTTSGAEGLAALAEHHFDLLLCDLMMPGMDGIQLLRRALELEPNLIGIIMTGHGTISTAIEAMKSGAFDYVLKPFNLQTMLPILDRALGVHRLREENLRLRRYVECLSFESPRYQMIGLAPAIERVVEMIRRVAPTDTTVLVRGASGTGKELVARAVHYNSPRCDRPLVTVNCAALQESLVESELFGHEKGAFTGADCAKPGLMEVARDGTLFIDEIAEMTPALQAKLLRVLEDGCYRRVGSTRQCHSNARIVAATNRHLEEEMKSGRFREDLFYRLNIVTIHLPPLRERREDIPALVLHFLTTRQTHSQPCQISPDAMQALVNYHWPGNIRELANVLERAQILADRNEITLHDLPDELQPSTVNPNPAVSLNLEAMERQFAQQALKLAKGNKVHAAHALGITRRTLYRLIRKHGLEASEGRIKSRS